MKTTTVLLIVPFLAGATAFGFGVFTTAEAPTSPEEQVLNITGVTASTLTSTSIQVRWSQPTGATTDEQWYYNVHYKFINSGVVVERTTEVPADVNVRYGQLYFAVTNLPPCTDILVWLSGYSRKKVWPSREPTTRPPQWRRNRYYRYRPQPTLPPKILPEVYRGAISEPIETLTGSLAPMQRIKVWDIKIIPKKAKNGTCYIQVSWKPKRYPFGCPILGMQIEYKTPSTWPNWQRVRGGLTTNIYGLEENMAYPFRVAPYNRFGTGTRTRMHFYSLPRAGPKAPIELHVETVTCRIVRVAWKRPDEKRQEITHYFVSYQSDESDVIEGVKVNAVKEEQNLTIENLMPNATYAISVTAVSDWGESVPARTTVITQPKDENSQCPGDSPWLRKPV